jgi:ribosomal protein L24E
LTFYFSDLHGCDTSNRSPQEDALLQETMDPACAVCGKPIEDGTGRYRLIIDDRLASAHVECRNKLKVDSLPRYTK